MMRLPALARSAALSLRPGPNPSAFPGLVVAAVALGFAVLTAPEVVRAQRDWRDGVGVVVVVDRPRKAIKVIPAAGQRRHRRRDHCRGGGARCRRWPTALRRVGPERRRCRRGPADDIDRGASVGFETESKYRLRLVGYPSVLGAHSQVDWNGKRYGIHGEPRIFKRLPSDGLRRLRDRP